MESANISYFITFVRSQINTTFKGDVHACNRYIEENLATCVTMMDKYTEQNNPWWLQRDANMAYHQLKEMDTLIVDYSIFIDTLSRLVDRPITSIDINKDYNNLMIEANEKYAEYVKNEVLEKHFSKQNTQSKNINSQSKTVKSQGAVRECSF